MSESLIRKYAGCQNCKTTQSCNKSHYNICSEFDLCNIIGEKPKKSKSECSRCYNNHYNQEKCGCYGYSSSKIILKSIYYSNSQRPPFNLEWKLSCWRK